MNNARTKKIFAEVFAFPEQSIQPDLALRSVPRWDSLAHMMMIARIEEEHGIQMTGDEIASIKTFSDLTTVLAAHGIND
jgi:acyl carrier protein